MKERTVVTSLLSICAIWLIALPFMLTGCDIKQDSQTQVSINVSLRTITHDNHQFVIADHLRGTAILHHPDCHCQKDRK